MRTWTLHGVKIGTYCDASVLNDLSNLEDMHTFADETVRRFDDNMEMDGADVSGFYSVYCAIKATKRMTAVEIRQLLDDTALFNTTKTPSLIYVDIGTKVCIVMWNPFVLQCLFCRYRHQKEFLGLCVML